MASGALLTSFLDFISGTGVGRLSKPDHPGQLVTRHTWLWPRLWKNNGQPVQGGQNLTFWFLPNTAQTFEETLPGSTTIPKNLQVLQKGVCDWRYTRVHSVYVDQEILLNDRIRYGTRDVQFEQFVSIRDEKATIRKTDSAVGLETQLAAVPDKSKMEGLATTGATSPYSLFAHINECGYGTTSAGLYGTSPATGTAWTATTTAPAWTVKENIDPTAAAMNANMNVTQQKYFVASQDAGNNAANIIGGLDGLWMNIDWEQPDSLSQYQQDEQMNNIMFLTTKQGRQAVMALMRHDQDRYVMGAQDPSYPDPQFRGIPLKRWDAMETAAIYDASTATGTLNTEGAAVGSQFAGPRIIAANGNHLYPVCHDERMAYVDPPQRHLQVPDTWVQYETTWWQLVCKSYKHQGILFPGANLYTSTATGGNLYA